MNTITIDSLSDLPKVAELVLESLNGRNVVAFFAPMGAGKTTLISTLMETLGSEDIVTSPTFALVNQYYTSEREPVYHFYFYPFLGIKQLLELAKHHPWLHFAKQMDQEIANRETACVCSSRQCGIGICTSRSRPTSKLHHI